MSGVAEKYMMVVKLMHDNSVTLVRIAARGSDLRFQGGCRIAPRIGFEPFLVCNDDGLIDT